MKRIPWFLLTASLFFAGQTYFSRTAFAQPNNVLRYTPPTPVKAPIGGSVEVRLPFTLQEGYHVNSNKPPDPYLIPLRLTWSKGPLQAGEVMYPKPAEHKIESEPKPLLVYSGTFELTATFTVPRTAVTGPAAMNGKLRYQACNDKMCLAPKDLDVNLQLDIVK